MPPPLRGGSRAASTEIGKAAKLASLRQGGLLIRFRHCRHGGTQTGTHVKSNGNGNGNGNGNDNDNGNGNGNGNGNSNSNGFLPQRPQSTQRNCHSERLLQGC